MRPFTQLTQREYDEEDRVKPEAAFHAKTRAFDVALRFPNPLAPLSPPPSPEPHQ